MNFNENQQDFTEVDFNAMMEAEGGYEAPEPEVYEEEKVYEEDPSNLDYSDASDLWDDAFENGEDDGGDEETVIGEDGEEHKITSTFSNFDAIPDDKEFFIGGESITKGELMTKLNTSKEADDYARGFREWSMGMNTKLEEANNILQTSMSETDKRIRDIEIQINTSTSDAETGLLYRKLQDARSRKAELENDIQSMNEKSSTIKREMETARLITTDREMYKKNSNWGAQSSEVVSMFVGVGLGQMVKDYACTDLMDIAVDAMKWRKHEAASRKAVKEAPTKSKSRSVPSKSKSKAESLSSRKQKALNAFKNGEDVSEYFDVLED